MIMCNAFTHPSSSFTYQILNSDTCASPTVTKRNEEPVTGSRRNGTMSETRRGVSKRISQPPRALDNGGATRKSKANINTEDIDTGT